MYEIVRLIEVAKAKNKLPKYLLLENVKNLVGSKFIGDFNNLNKFFDEIGYNVYWQVINAKECGIPQNRERVFGMYIRKDIDTGRFTFPEPFDSGLRLKDVLEENVEEKYYVDNEKTRALIDDLLESGKLEKDISNTVRGGQSFARPTSVGSCKSVGCAVSKYASKLDKCTEYAGTLQSRDYKGFGNQQMNGVIEINDK